MATITEIISNIAYGVATHIVLIGNSVCVGSGATHATAAQAQAPYLIADSQLNNTYTDTTSAVARWKLKPEYRYSAIIPTTWAQSFRTAILAKNVNSSVRNEGGSGYCIKDHLRGVSGVVGTPETNASDNTVSVILGATNVPTLAIVPLVINDVVNRPFAEFQSNIRLLTANLLANNIAVVLVKENAINGYDMTAWHNDLDAVAAYYNDPARYPGMVGVADTYTPTAAAITANGGFAADLALTSLATRMMYDNLHPAQRGHDLIAEQYVTFFTPPVIPPQFNEFIPRILTSQGYRPGRVYLKDAAGFRRVNAEVLT